MLFDDCLMIYNNSVYLKLDQSLFYALFNILKKLRRLKHVQDNNADVCGDHFFKIRPFLKKLRMRK